ncbi:Predicted membrane protein [Paraburkholderia phenazinium]|uniref:Predicted membrane protein n=1 Tax=Paraburkholderia phenazinium TaxID=60549 RepID=A0A1G8NTP9_9BURK|nr:DUF2157 domain-containing protein [Paraburkholderia phenazinium]SDI83547.1 Predicted membrane protein [Paraburkholderia phenazinium]
MKAKETFSLFDSLDCRFPPTPLYRPDLEQIIEIGIRRGLEVTIADGAAEFDDLDDVKENRGERIKELRLSFSKESAFFKSLSLKIGDGGMKLSCSNDDELIPAWHEMQRAIKKHVPYYARYASPSSWLLVTLGVIALVGYVNWPPHGTPARFVLVLTPLMLMFWSMFYLKANRVIYLQKKHEVKGLLDRYGEKLVFAIVGAALAVVGQIVVKIYLGK